MKLGKHVKGPTERKRYRIDYSQWLDTNEIISSANFEVAPITDNMLVIDDSSIATPPTAVVFFANSGKEGAVYTLDVTIVTDGGQVKNDSIIFSIRDQ